MGNGNLWHKHPGLCQIPKSGMHKSRKKHWQLSGRVTSLPVRLGLGLGI